MSAYIFENQPYKRHSQEILPRHQQPHFQRWVASLTATQPICFVFYRVSGPPNLQQNRSTKIGLHIFYAVDYGLRFTELTVKPLHLTVRIDQLRYSDQPDIMRATTTVSNFAGIVQRLHLDTNKLETLRKSPTFRRCKMFVPDIGNHITMLYDTNRRRRDLRGAIEKLSTSSQDFPQHLPQIIIKNPSL